MDSKKNTIINILIFVVFLVFLSTIRSGSNTAISFGETGMTLGGPKGFTLTVEYEQIESLELVENRGLGAPVSGSENRKCRWGEWENETWGRYTLCALKKLDNAVCLTTLDGQVVVFNYEDAETTESILQMIQDLLADLAGQKAA